MPCTLRWRWRRASARSELAAQWECCPIAVTHGEATASDARGCHTECCSLSRPSLGAHVELFDVLVENGAQINYQSSEVGEQSALHLAAESGRLGFVKKLLHSGADPELKDRNGKRAIELASQNGKDRAKLALQGPHTGARLCYGSRADGSGQMCCFRWRPRSADVVQCMNDVVACVGEIVPVQAVPSKPTAEPTGKPNVKPAKPTAAPTVKLAPAPKPATAARTTEPTDALASASSQSSETAVSSKASAAPIEGLCQLDVVDAGKLTSELFKATYDGRRPFVLRGATNDWKALQASILCTAVQPCRISSHHCSAYVV